jgi:hypothetical protein
MAKNTYPTPKKKTFGRRLIDRFGNDGGEYEYQSNLNAKENKPGTIIQDPAKGRDTPVRYQRSDLYSIDHKRYG